MSLLMCPKCRNVHVEYYRVVDLAECQDCFHRFHLRGRPSSISTGADGILPDRTVSQLGSTDRAR
jgi:hypothetical protein